MSLSKLFLKGLQNIDGVTFYDIGKKAKDKISLVFRYTDPQGKRTTLATKSFDPKTATETEVKEEIAPLLKEVESKIQKKGGNVNVIREQYTKAKIGFTDELINWLETNASNPKYKSPEQLLQAAEKAFNQPKYTQVPAKVEKAKAFFNKERGFILPKQYEFYGKNITTKNIKKPLKDMAMIALLKSDNPQFVGKKDTLLKYFARDPKSPKPELTKEEIKFLNMFSKEYIKGGAGGAGVKGGQETGSVMFRFLKNEGANFENKLNEWNEIRRLETDIKKELELGGLTQNRINFLTKTLKATQDKRKNISEKLRKEYPDLLSGKTGDVSGALVQEHKIARAIGEKSESFIPSTYLAKAEFTPAAFNLQKLQNFDKPLMKYIDQYNKAPQSQRPEIIKQIKNLKKDFNLKSGGYLDDVDIQFGIKTVKLKDKTPFVFETSPEQTYSQILKNIKHSNTYFKNIGMNDRIISGDTFNAFQKDLKTRIANQKGSNLKSTLIGLGIGVPTTSMTLDALEQNPLRAAELEQTVNVPEDIEFGDPETWDKKVLDFVKEYPVMSGTAAGVTTVGGAALTKTGRKVMGKISQAALSTPAGAALINLGLGVDPTETLDRVFLEGELAAAPGLIKSAEAITTNPLLRKALTLGISPRTANIMSGAGIIALTGEALYERAKAMTEEAERISAMEPGEEQQRAMEEYLAKDYRGYAIGGRVNFGKGGSYDYDSMDHKINSLIKHYNDYLKMGGKMKLKDFAPLFARENFKDGSKPPKMDRRLFMKIMAGIMSLPILGKVGKVAKPTVKALGTELKAAGMPKWFGALVDKVIREGTDVTKQFATKEREVVHVKQLGEAEGVRVTQDLETGKVTVEYDSPTNMGEESVTFTYKPAEVLEEGKIVPSKFEAIEAEPRIVNWDGDIEFVDEFATSNVDELMSDTSSLKQFATGTLDSKDLKIRKEKVGKVEKINVNTGDALEHIESSQRGIVGEMGGSIEDYLYEAKRVGDIKDTGEPLVNPNLIIKGKPKK